MTAREFAEAIARELGGAVRQFPDDDDDGQFAVITVDGRVPLMVRKYLSGTLGACVPGALAFAGREADFDATRLASFRTAAFAWLMKHPKALSMYGVALALIDALADLAPYNVRIPSPTDPTELWLETADAGNLGVFPGRVSLGRSWTIQTRAELDEALPRIRGAVRQSQLEIATYRDASAKLAAAAKLVADAIAANTSQPTTVGYREDRVKDELRLEITCGERPVVVKLDTSSGAVRVHAGIVGQGDVEVSLAELDVRMPELAAALVQARATFTVRDLRRKARYHVLSNVGDLSAGEEVTYWGLDDIDNHYGEYVFHRASDGKELRVGGDCSTPERGPLGDAHRYLKPIE